MQNYKRLKKHNNAIIDEYLKRGFGSMTKNDFEVMIMHHLLQSDLQGMSNYAISRMLGIPESKVKRLIYEVNLQYEEEETDLLVNFLTCLAGAKYKRDNDRIKFIIEDVATRRYLDSKLKENNLFSDTSFNTELVVIKPQALNDILKTLLKEEYVKEIKERIEGVSRKMKKEQRTEGLLKILGTLTNGLISNTIGDLVELIKNEFEEK